MRSFMVILVLPFSSLLMDEAEKPVSSETFLMDRSLSVLSFFRVEPTSSSPTLNGTPRNHLSTASCLYIKITPFQSTFECCSMVYRHPSCASSNLVILPPIEPLQHIWFAVAAPSTTDLSR